MPLKCDCWSRKFRRQLTIEIRLMVLVDEYGLHVKEKRPIPVDIGHQVWLNDSMVPIVCDQCGEKQFIYQEDMDLLLDDLPEPEETMKMIRAHKNGRGVE